MAAILSRSPTSQKPANLPVRMWRSNAIWLSLMFIAGIVAGSAGTIIQVDRMRREMLAHPDRIVDRLTSDIRRDAGLNDSETENIRTIVERHHQRMMSLIPRMAEEFDALEKDIGEALTTTQRERWEPRFKQFRQHVFP